MAKKTVSSLQKNIFKKKIKVIRIVKSKKSQAYIFEEKIVSPEEVNNFFLKN